jgi:hypothetical protein
MGGPLVDITGTLLLAGCLGEHVLIAFEVKGEPPHFLTSVIQGQVPHFVRNDNYNLFGMTSLLCPIPIDHSLHPVTSGVTGKGRGKAVTCVTCHLVLLGLYLFLTCA